jgi:hypothetical protein
VSSDSSSDSGEDEENEIMHKLRQLYQAAVKELPLTIEIDAEYDWGLRKFEAVFFKTSKNTRKIEDIFAPLYTAYAELETVGRTFQGALPHSCWMLKEQVRVSVLKVGEGIHLRYSRNESSAVDIDTMPDQVQVQLIGGWNVCFGANDNAKDGELTQRMLYITYQIHEITKMYMQPWQIRLEGLFMRAGEKGQRVAGFCAIGNGGDDERQLPAVPYCAKNIPTHYDAARGKETNALLIFGHDNQWPLSISVVFPVSLENTVQITYEVTWEKFKVEKGVVSTDGCWERFKARAEEDQIVMPAAFNEPGEVWNPCLRKEDNSLRVIFRRGSTWNPEDEGPVTAVLFGPEATIKLRTTASNPIEQVTEGIALMYSGRYHIVEEVATREWALVASFGDRSRVGAIPTFYRFQTP